jgi:hypothetical protein
MIVNWFANIFNEFIFILIFPGILLGIAAITASKFVPNFLPQYKLPAQIGGLVLITFFLFQYGREWEYDKAKIKHEEDKALITKLSGESKDSSAKVIIKYKDRIKYVDRIKDVKTTEYITKEDDGKCNIDDVTSGDITRLLNVPATGKLPDSTSGVDVTTNKTR